MDSKPEKKVPDWERIEANYRAGVMSLREIAQADGNIVESAIRKRAKRDDWTRDLNAKVKVKADALVRKDMVRSQVRTETASEKLTVEIEAEVQARIRLEHRSDINRNRSLAAKLLAELEGQTDGLDLLDQLGELMRAPDEKGNDKRNELYQKIISTPSRVDSHKKLVETLKNLIGLERQAFGIDDGAPPALPAKNGDVSDALARIDQLNGRLNALTA